MRRRPFLRDGEITILRVTLSGWLLAALVREGSLD